MRRTVIWSLGAALLAVVTLAAAPRFVVDDDEYADKVIEASTKLLKAGKLRPTEKLSQEVAAHGRALKLALPGHQKLEPPDLYDRLRESTLAVGSFYKCPDCNDWHFSSSTGFVVSENGIISTCCHVVLGEDNDKVTESYLVAADAAGHVYPIRSVLAADPEADTCFLKIEATGLKPLPLRPGVRVGERVYCLSHPAGFYFMFTQGMVARLNRKTNEMLDEHGQTNGLLSRPVLFLNVTAEFAPGSSGAPVVDEAGNVVAQVASVTEAGQPMEGADTNAPASPSVPVRFCTAAEEILGLTNLQMKGKSEGRNPKPEGRPKPEVRKLRRPMQY